MFTVLAESNKTRRDVTIIVSIGRRFQKSVMVDTSGITKMESLESTVRITNYNEGAVPENSTIRKTFAWIVKENTLKHGGLHLK